MSARLIEWSAEWLTQLLIEWLTSMSAADWKCQDWKSLMQAPGSVCLLIEKLFQWLTQRSTERLSEWLIEWFTEWLTE